MKVSIRTHKLILKSGLVISTALLASSAFGLMGGADPESLIRPMLPMGVALGLFNALLCISVLRD